MGSRPDPFSQSEGAAGQTRLQPCDNLLVHVAPMMNWPHPASLLPFYCRDMEYKILERLGKINMHLVKVTTNFDPRASFSKLTLNCRLQDPQIKLDELIDIDAAGLRSSAIWDILQSSGSGTEFKNVAGSENTVMKEVLELLARISTEVLISQSYCESHSNIKVANLGIGSKNTWHGTPDIRARGINGELTIIGTNTLQL